MVDWCSITVEVKRELSLKAKLYILQFIYVPALGYGHERFG